MNKLKLALVGFSTMLFGLAPLAAEANAVQIEGRVAVANVTAGQTSYSKSINAKLDDVVKVQVWYHNREEANSGLVANNLTVKIALPSQPGTVQTVNGTISSSNSNTVTDSSTINLADANDYLDFIPGSAEWRHNIGDNTNINYVTTKISDNVVTTGVNLGNENPCFNYEANVTVLARVKAPLVTINKEVKVDGQTNYVIENSAKPGDLLDYVLIIKNMGSTTLKGVQVADGLPPYMTYAPGSTKLVNSATGTNGKVLGDGITNGGITIDDMAPGSTQYVYLKARVNTQIACGDHRLKNVGSVRAFGTNQIFNTAYTDINVVCSSTTTPTPTTTPAPQPLPATGPESALAGVVGMSGIGYAASAYLRSKRSLIDALRK